MSLRVVIADDSSFFREILRETLERDGDLKVVAEAADGAEVLELVAAQRPDLLFLDLQMPALDGLVVLEQLMASHPLPVVIVTARPAGPGAALVFEALRRGALEVVEKGVVAERPDSMRALAREVARVPVVYRPRPRPRFPAPSQGPIVEAGPAGSARLIGVGASAGGPPAVAALLSSLPPGFGGCVLVVQHLSPGFAGGYASFLQTSSALPVRLATEGAALARGVVYVAPDERHLIVEEGRLALRDGGPWPYRPSIDALFLSLAHEAGANAVAVVLSGMGRDGAQGAQAVARAGGRVFAQDEATSTVFGMPKVTADTVLGTTVLGLPQLGPALRALTEKRPRD